MSDHLLTVVLVMLFAVAAGAGFALAYSGRTHRDPDWAIPLVQGALLFGLAIWQATQL